MRYFCVHNTARTSAPHIELNFIHDCTLSMTVKDAVAKCFEQFYDQREIHPNKLATHAGAYSKIDLLLHS